MKAAGKPDSKRRLRLGRAAAAASLILLALTLLAGAHAYLAKRLILDPGITGLPQQILLGGIAVAFAALLIGPILERRLRNPWRRRLVLPSLVWMGGLWITLNALFVSEAVLWLTGAASSSPDPSAPAAVRAAAVVAVSISAIVLGMRSALAVPAVRKVEVQLARWPRALDGFRIAQISDIHIGPILDRRFAAGVVDRVNELGADLVAVTGDLVDGSVSLLREEVAPFAGLSARYGVWFVIGNHDAYSGDEAWAAHAAELGMQPLRNERVAIGGEEGFDLAGVDDYRGNWVHGTKHDMARALEGRDPGRAVVLLAHDPSSFAQASRAGVDLQLSGHTHGGQIWPFGFLVRLAVPWVAGLHQRGGSQLYVSRGTGFWGPPIRLFAPAEITEITIRPA